LNRIRFSAKDSTRSLKGKDAYHLSGTEICDRTLWAMRASECTGAHAFAQSEIGYRNPFIQTCLRSALEAEAVVSIQIQYPVKIRPQKSSASE